MKATGSEGPVACCFDRFGIQKDRFGKKVEILLGVCYSSAINCFNLSEADKQAEGGHGYSAGMRFQEQTKNEEDMYEGK